MNNDKKARSAFTRRLSTRILGRFALTLVITWIAALLVLFVGILIGARVNWNTGGWFYRAVVSPLSVNRYLIIISTLVVSAVVVFLFYWRKTIGYLQNVADATAAVYNKDEELIVLPDELREIEDQLNSIKMAAARGERAAREAEQRKNDLIVYLAHDLKTPLTSVLGYLSLLRDEQRISPELQRRYLSIAHDKAQRLEDLINEFFEITRFNLTALSLERSRVDLSRMLQQLLFEFEPMMAEKALTHRLAAPPAAAVYIDADKMQRVFDNLLRNAVNYSDEGGQIGVELTERGDSVAICVTNAGSAIPPDKLSRVFEQFYRLDAARSSRSGGAGLGLAIAKQIVNLHGGDIAAKSAGGQTAFTVTIPKTQEQA